ncbi:unnamed protein product [Brassica rapa subsp. narinosa]
MQQKRWNLWHKTENLQYCNKSQLNRRYEGDEALVVVHTITLTNSSRNQFHKQI